MSQSKTSPRPGGHFGLGVALAFVCIFLVFPAGILVSTVGGEMDPDWAYGGLMMWALFGVSQWLFVLPLGIFLHVLGRHETAKGLWITAGVVLLLNGGCFGLVTGNL